MDTQKEKLKQTNGTFDLNYLNNAIVNGKSRNVTMELSNGNPEKILLQLIFNRIVSSINMMYLEVGTVKRNCYSKRL